ncbi:MAG TPA: transcriptional regulator [Mycobacterium sp.]|nr:transcriptional regulator [Mycobacterium sp.]
MSEQFSLNLLGKFAVYHGDRPVELPPACQRLVALVALKRRPVHRLWVCAMLWPHAPTRRAVASLRSAMWRLRPIGADPLLVVDPQYVALAPEVTVDWHDAVDLIEQLLDDDQPAGADPTLVADLLPLLRAGDLLDRWAEQWLSDERDRYHARRMAALDVLGRGADKQVASYACSALRSTHTLRSVRAAKNDSSEP